MNVLLRIKKDNFLAIKSGIKKTEWRNNSKYNINLLFVKKEDGKNHGNDKIKTITFINGYSEDSDKLVIEVNRIRLVKFSKNITIPEDNFSALEGQFSIEISLGNIL